MNPAAEAARLHALLAASGSPVRAIAEQRYLKSDLQHLGTSVPAMRSVVRGWVRAQPAASHDDVFGVADELWAMPIHECRSAAVELLHQRPASVAVTDLPWIEARLRECRTWALVDPLAGWVTADLAAREPDAVMPVLDRWVGDPDVWVRRAAVLREVAARHPDEMSSWLRAHMEGMNLVTLREPMRKLPDAASLREAYDTRRNSPG